ncbi:MAG: glycosyltransferase family 9 protein [Ignavibacteria bacterium]
MTEIKKILVIRFSSFGDIVLTYPFITQLKRVFPNAQIDFLTKEKFSYLVKMHNDVDNVLVYNGEKISELRKNIKKNNYNLVLDIHKNIRSIFSTLYSNPKKIRYIKGTLKKLLLVALKINLFGGELPVYKRYLLALDKIRFLDNLDFNTTNLDFEKEPIIKEPYILIAPSSKHFTKTLPKEKFEQIIKGIQNKKIILVGDSFGEDMSICKYLSEKSANTLSYSGKTDFKTLTNLIYNSELVLCNDSGVLHLAEALNKKVIVFFGSTVKEFGFFPQLKSTIVFENKNLKCRPCTHIGKNYCPEKHFKCMNDIIINDILNKIYENIS